MNAIVDLLDLLDLAQPIARRNALADRNDATLATAADAPGRTRSGFQSRLRRERSHGSGPDPQGSGLKPAPRKTSWRIDR